MSYILVAVETVGIQPYLFGSNRLRENIGASEIVKQATEEWIVEAIARLKLRHNLAAFGPNRFDESLAIERDKLEVELVYAGGGNALLIFSGAEPAYQFVKTLTEQAMANAPGLSVVVAQSDPFEWTDLLSQIYQTLLKKELARKKVARQSTALLLGLGVTAACQSTGLPAVSLDPDDDRLLIAAEIVAKLAYRTEAEKRMESLFKVANRGYQFAKDFNELGTADEASYIAVIHADGNGIGQRLQSIASSATDNRQFIQQIRQFSQFLKQVSIRSLQRVIERLIARIIQEKGDFKIKSNGIEIELKTDRKSGKLILPFSPLVVGGDDTTFVCDGRLGLTLAALYLQSFRDEVQKNKKFEDIHACAGVAIVHNHFPFARAYELSDRLCGRAKAYVRIKKEITMENGISALDWHFGINGLLYDLSTIRRQQYIVAAGQLYNRPVRLTKAELDPVFSWANFRDITLKFQQDWGERRNKLKALHQTLRQGPQATRQYLRAYNLKGRLPPISKDTDDFASTGWNKDGICGYFDALEAADYFIDLE